MGWLRRLRIRWTNYRCPSCGHRADTRGTMGICITMGCPDYAIGTPPNDIWEAYDGLR